MGAIHEGSGIGIRIVWGTFPLQIAFCNVLTTIQTPLPTIKTLNVTSHKLRQIRENTLKSSWKYSFYVCKISTLPEYSVSLTDGSFIWIYCRNSSETWNHKAFKEHYFHRLLLTEIVRFIVLTCIDIWGFTTVNISCKCISAVTEQNQ